MTGDRTATGAARALPRTEGEIVAAASALGLRIETACMPGVVTNLALLATHANRLVGPGGG
jgi:hypothetical protein